MKTIKRIAPYLMVVVMIVLLISASAPVFASGEGSVMSGEISESAADQGNETSAKAIAAAVVIGIGSATGAIAMGLAIGKAVDNIARQPEAAANIRSSLTLGLVFIETAIIYALVVAVMIIFVL